jgi:hypothetical protein
MSLSLIRWFSAGVAVVTFASVAAEPAQAPAPEPQTATAAPTTPAAPTAETNVPDEEAVQAAKVRGVPIKPAAEAVPIKPGVDAVPIKPQGP